MEIRTKNHQITIIACKFWLVLLVLVSYQPFAMKQTIMEEQRQIFLNAEKLVHHSNSTKYQKLYRKLNGYPLRPYLDKAYLINHLSIKKLAEIDRFLDKYQGSPLDWPLRKKWLAYLAKKNRPVLFLKYFKPTSDAKLTCYNKRFQLKAGIPASVVLPSVTRLWVVGKSQPKACDPLFKQWKKAGYRTEHVILQRLEKAADGGKHTLIPYLKLLLKPQNRYLADLWYNVRRNPDYISRIKHFSHRSDVEKTILTYGLKRLIWRKPSRAIKAYSKIMRQFTLTKQQIIEINQKFAVALASKNHPEASKWLNKLSDDQLTNNLIQWKLAHLLTSNDWSKIVKGLNNFPEKSRKTLQWKYWYGTALGFTGKLQESKKILTQLAMKRHYYGFLAASKMSVKPNLEHEAIAINSDDKEKLLQNPAAQRAFELYTLGRTLEARREWDYWLSKLNKQQKINASKLSHDLDWADRAIFTLAKVGYLNDVDLRFPLTFQAQIRQNSHQNKINPAWAFAIVRRESSFITDASSSAGAKGLMQLLPSTARHVMKRYVPVKQLYNPDKNIAIGTRYLKELYDKHNGNQVLATAAYNAGPNRVKRWLNNTPLSADIWIETIPFKETREYVKSVLAYQQIYQLKLGQTKSIFNEVSTMKIGS